MEGNIRSSGEKKTNLFWGNFLEDGKIPLGRGKESGHGKKKINLLRTRKKKGQGEKDRTDCWRKAEHAENSQHG